MCLFGFNDTFVLSFFHAPWPDCNGTYSHCYDMVDLLQLPSITYLAKKDTDSNSGIDNVPGKCFIHY